MIFFTEQTIKQSKNKGLLHCTTLKSSFIFEWSGANVYFKLVLMYDQVSISSYCAALQLGCNCRSHLSIAKLSAAKIATQLKQGYKPSYGAATLHKVLTCFTEHTNEMN